MAEMTVADAASALVAEGQKPTQEAVRQRLGGGSFATIGPLLREWRAAQEHREALAVVEVPASVSTLLSEVGQRVWTEARTLAEAGREGLVRDLAKARAQAEDDAAEAAASLDRLQARLTEAEAQVQAAQDEAAAARAQRDQEHQAASGAAAAAAEARAEAAVLRERVQAAEDRASQAETARRDDAVAASAAVSRLEERLASRENSDRISAPLMEKP